MAFFERLDTDDLFCEACGTVCYPMSCYVNHLLSAEHQANVSQQAYHWALPERECAVIVETSTKDRITWSSILNKLAKLDLDYSPRDFVANSTNPINFGVVRFGSLDAVDKLFANNGKGSMLIVDGHVVRIKRVVELSPTEWRSMVPEPSDDSSDRVSNQSLLWMEKMLGEPLHGGQKRGCEDMVSKFHQEVPKSKMKKTDLTKDKPSSTESAILATANNWEMQMKALQNLLLETDYGLSMTKLDSRSLRHVKTQFSAICKAIETPPKHTRAAFYVSTTIIVMFGLNFPKLKVTQIPLRHKNLELGSHRAGDWLIFLCLEERRTLSFDWKVLHNKSFKRPLSMKFTEQHSVLEHIESGVKFEYVTNPQLQPEVSSYQLVVHLGTFDGRTTALLTLLRFWALRNGVTFAEGRISKNPACHHTMSDSSVLDWLCIFYLCREKVIPTPRQVRESTPKPIFISLEGLKVDVGFSEDPKFVLEWQSKNDPLPYNLNSDEFVLSVLKLAEGFFQFYTRNNFEGCVLNTMDAEVISATDVKNGLKGPCTKLDLIEWSRLRKLKLGDRKEPGIYVMQPFFPCYTFSACRTKFKNIVLPLMRRTEEKLQVYLENLQQLEDGNETCLMSDINLESVFT